MIVFFYYLHYLTHQNYQDIIDFAENSINNFCWQSEYINQVYNKS